MSYHKRNLIILSVAIFLVSLSWTQIIPFLPRYLIQLGVRENLTAWSAFILGVQAIAGIVFMPLWGKLGDKYGRKPMIIRAGFFLSAIYIAMVFCSKPWHLAFLRFLNGMLTGFMPGSFALIAVNTPKNKAGRYVAVAQSAAAFGGVAGPVTGGSLADLIGIRGTMWISGTLVLICTIVVGVLVQEPVKAGSGKQTSLLQDYIICWKNSVMRYIMINNWTNAIITSTVTSTLIIYLSKVAPGVSGTMQGIIYAIPGILVGTLSLRWVRVGEKLTNRKAIATGLIGAGVFYTSMGAAGKLWIFVIAFVLCRIFATALNPLLASIISQEISPEFRGRAFGINTSVGIIGDLSAQITVASIGQLLGIRVLYVIIGIMVSILGFYHYLSLAKSQNQDRLILADITKSEESDDSLVTG